MALLFQTLALLELEADINQQQQQRSFSPSSSILSSIEQTISPSAIIEVNMPNFSKNIRKAFLLGKTSENTLIFGGNLTYLHIRDNERNKIDLEIPSILKFVIFV